MDLAFWATVLVVSWFNAMAAVLVLAWTVRWLGVKFPAGTWPTLVVLLFAWPVALALMGACWLYVAYLGWRDRP